MVDINLLKKHLKVIDSQFSDLNLLNFLDDIANENKIIGLGEATHGNKELHQVRSYFSKYLIQHCGFDGVIMEFPTSKSEDMNKYVATGEGDINNLMNNLGYWTCATEEIQELVTWLQNFNKSHPNRKVKLFGNDVEVDDKIRLKAAEFRDKRLADITIKIAGSNKYILWAHNHHVSKTNYKEFASLGYYLSQKVKYYAVGTLFHEGSLTAMEYDSKHSQWKDIREFGLSPAEKGSLESELNKFGIPQFFLDLNNLPKELKKQFTNVNARFLGAGFDPKANFSLFEQMNFAKMFDGLVFIRKVNPSKLVSEE